MHDIDFFRDEIRNGFYIPTAIKQSWAAGLDVLSEIDRICKKYQITYYADWGSFLGAVRHGGFVPWDDDLDICMRRDDYRKFRKAAAKELPDNFTIHDYRSKEDHWLFLARVVNNKVMCFDEDYLREHNNYPWLTGVDIFLKDYLYIDPEEEKARDKEIMNIIALADGITEGRISTDAAYTHLGDIIQTYEIKIPDGSSNRDISVALYELAERIMGRVEKENSDTIGQIFPWILKGQEGEPKKYYEKVIRLPFEDTTIPVPAWYHTVLKRRYWDYHIIYKKWDAHDYPAFEGQIADMERLLGEKIPSFRFDSGMLERPGIDLSGSFKTLVGEAHEEFTSLFTQIEEEIRTGALEFAKGTLGSAQQLAIDMGNLTEQVRGEDDPKSKLVVEALQGLCDCIFEEYQAIEVGRQTADITDIRESRDRLSKAVEENIINRREVLFLPIGPKEWQNMEGFVAEECDKGTDIRIVPIPLLKKDYFGNIVMSDDEIREASNIDGYPTGYDYTDWMKYDIRLHCPDKIYIQNPYDGWNPCLTVPPDFYASNLRKYSRELIYVPIGKTAEFTKEDEKDVYNLKHYVTAPGVVYADKVIVQSDNIKDRYIEALTSFAGKKTKRIWTSKILVSTNYRKEERISDKKRLLYCIGANDLSEHGQVLERSVKERLELLKHNSDHIDISIGLYPPDRRQWEKMDKALSRILFNMMEEAESYGIKTVELIPNKADDIAGSFDAYYGSMSPVVESFIEQSKPVMLCNYDVDEGEG